jgi:hypothetical protein
VSFKTEDLIAPIKSSGENHPKTISLFFIKRVDRCLRVVYGHLVPAKWAHERKPKCKR